MYSYQSKIKVFLLLLIGAFVGCSNVIFGADLSDKIYDSFREIYDKGLSNNYLDSAYESKYSKDPFGDNLDAIDDMKIQLEIAGAKYIENELAANNCSLSKKKIRGILYYFVPEFRAKMSRELKIKSGNTDSKDFVFDESTIKDYCEDFLLCVAKAEGSYEKGFLGIRRYKISAATPADIMTNCKEYFQSAYAKGNSNENRMQGVNGAWAGNDKYWNATTDDSPYDIMSDLSNVGVLLYEDSVLPMTPVFYNLPVFSNSAQSLSNAQNNSSNTGGRSGSRNGNFSGLNGRGSSGSIGGASLGLNGRDSGNGGLNKNNTQTPSQGLVNLGNRSEGGHGLENRVREESKSEKTGIVADLNKSGLSGGIVSDIYDELVEGLGVTVVTDRGKLFYGSLCDDEEEIEVEPEGDVEPNRNIGGNTPIPVEDEVEDAYVLSTEEYEEVVDYMLSAVDQYVVLSDDVVAGIIAKLGNSGGNSPSTTSTQGDDESEKRDCVESCKGLRADQYLSCVEMCACWEGVSPIFDPEGELGLGPIAMIRLCTVPATDMKFSEGGRKIISIDEGSKEILGVVDKLSREGKLGIRTQQNNFLDSSTKKMKISNSVAFSIEMENVDTSEKFEKSSQQYEDTTLQINNEEWQSIYNISSSLSDPSRKNQYRIVGYTGENINDYKGQIDASSFRQSQEIIGLDIYDRLGDSDADRYVSISEGVDKFIEQQANFWQELQKYVEYMTEYAKALYAKKK